VYGRLGESQKARHAVQEMEESQRRSGQDPLALHATAYLGMGLKDEALASLQQACEKRAGFLVWLAVDPIYDPLRSDPRFQNLLRCVGLAR
jgi:hypothetical protein